MIVILEITPGLYLQ